MPPAADNEIVTRVIELACVTPAMAPLDVLDRALQGHEGSHPDFTNRASSSWLFTDHRDPPAPFADLLRRPSRRT